MKFEIQKSSQVLLNKLEKRKHFSDRKLMRKLWRKVMGAEKAF